jgi:hypothetical protein
LDLALLEVLRLWGFLDPSLAPRALLLVGSALAGKAMGTGLFRRARPGYFAAAVFGTLFLTGALGIVTAFGSLL